MVTKSKDGRVVVWMKEDWKDEGDANKAAFAAIKGRFFTVISRPYKDTARVTQEMKSARLEESADLDGSIKRAVHDPKRLNVDEEQNGTI